MRLFGILLSSCMNFFYILDINPLSDIWLANIFYHFLEMATFLPFHFVHFFFCYAKVKYFFSLMKSHILTFSFVAYDVDSCSFYIPICWVFLSWNDVVFCLKVFLHLLRWSYIFCSIYVMHYIYWFTCVELLLRPRDKFHLIMAYNPFYVSYNWVC